MTEQAHTADHPMTTFQDDDEGGQWWRYCYTCQRRVERMTEQAREAPEPLTPCAAHRPAYHNGCDECARVTSDAALRQARETPEPLAPEEPWTKRTGSTAGAGSSVVTPTTTTRTTHAPDCMTVLEPEGGWPCDCFGIDQLRAAGVISDGTYGPFLDPAKVLAALRAVTPDPAEPDWRALLLAVVTGQEYDRMDAEGNAAAALGLAWAEPEGRWVALSDATEGQS
jgi:hypothetical protein